MKLTWRLPQGCSRQMERYNWMNKIRHAYKYDVILSRTGKQMVLRPHKDDEETCTHQYHNYKWVNWKTVWQSTPGLRFPPSLESISYQMLESIVLKIISSLANIIKKISKYYRLVTKWVLKFLWHRALSVFLIMQFYRCKQHYS